VIGMKTHAGAIAMLRKHVERHDSIRAAAADLHVSEQLLSATLAPAAHTFHRAISRKILSALRLRRVVMYEAAPRPARRRSRHPSRVSRPAGR
jgi:hypothetical protein